MAASRKRILAISGSTRNNSTNEAILNFIKEKYSDVLDVELYKGIASLPHFNPDNDTEQVDASVQTLRKSIQNADGVIICTPEYVFSLPGALKNALEWMVSTTIFAKKPTALIVASGMGEKAFGSLQLIMKTLEAETPEQCALLIKGARSKLDEKGNFTDPSTEQNIDVLIKSLLPLLN